MYTVSQEFPDSVENMILLKNLQFSPDYYETLTKEGTHEDLILTKFRNDRVKIVDLLVKAYFWPSPETTATQCIIFVSFTAVAKENNLYRLKCKKCNKLFSTSIEFNEHVNIEHANIIPTEFVKCEVDDSPYSPDCENYSSSSKKLEEHRNMGKFSNMITLVIRVEFQPRYQK